MSMRMITGAQTFALTGSFRQLVGENEDNYEIVLSLSAVTALTFDHQLNGQNLYDPVSGTYNWQGGEIAVFQPGMYTIHTTKALYAASTASPPTGIVGVVISRWIDEHTADHHDGRSGWQPGSASDAGGSVWMGDKLGKPQRSEQHHGVRPGAGERSA